MILYNELMTKTLPITKAREQLPTLVANARKKWDEYEITVNGIPEAMIISKAQYDSWVETNEILSDPELMKAIKEGEEDLNAGRYYDWEDVKKELGLDVPSKNYGQGKKRSKRNL